ncbi:MAG TPA: hypothetical protein VFA07_12810 [Chthonomonadaceae bacterium]|nr:hypothetical protein [Chthonomonadaceae bacterium]
MMMGRNATEDLGGEEKIQHEWDRAGLLQGKVGHKSQIAILVYITGITLCQGLKEIHSGNLPAVEAVRLLSGGP